MTFQKITRIVSTILLLACCFLFANSFSMNGGKLYAQACLSAAIILGIIVFVTSLHSSKTHKEEETEETRHHEPILFEPKIFMLWVAPLAAFFIWEWTNALYAVALMGFFMMFIMRKRPLQSALIAVLAAIGFVFLFHNLMGLPLSTPGWWPDTSIIF